LIRWSAPDNGGSAITAFKIEVKSNSGTFLQDLIDCDGTKQTIVTAKVCAIPFTTLIA